MNITTRYMGLNFFWFNVKDLGGYSESEVSSALEAVRDEYASLPKPYHDYTVLWVQAMDKLAKANVSMPFVEMATMFIEQADEHGRFPEIETEIKEVLSELEELTGKTDEEIAKILIEVPGSGAKKWWQFWK